MTDLRQVWVLGANVELIRADQIISVYVKRSDDSDPWPLTLRQLGELKGEARPPESWPNIYGRLLELAKQRR
jgi:hypothetical protein